MGAPAANCTAASTSLKRSPDTTNDTDWEYEYDSNEFEDFYFTLDTSTHALKSTSRSQASGTKNKRRKFNPSKTDAQDASNKENSTTQPNDAGSTEPDNKLQVLDLQTENPLIMLDQQLYSCHWSTDLGSQFYVSHPKAVQKPLKPGRMLDVVGLSRARLVAIPATARRRENAPTNKTGGSAESPIAIGNDDENDNDNANEDEDEAAPLNAVDQPAAIVTQSANEESRPETSKSVVPTSNTIPSFLQRLAAIKQKKGETDEVLLSGIQNYKHPPNVDEIRKNALAADAEREKQKKAANARPATREPYKPRAAASSETTTPGLEQPQKKPGPMSGSEIRESLGLPG